MRKLAAIMFTDIEGFTALMQKDEARAVQLLDRHLEIYHREVRHHEGQTIKFMGDGTLTIFPSALQAVHCAIAMQKAFRKAPVIPVRIGIHLGDVILKDSDVFGDAVNLSSRIQTAGVSGSVMVSEKVHDELKNHPEIATSSLGYFRLKNVHQQVHLYAVVSGGLVMPDLTLLPDNTNDKLTNGSTKKAGPFFGLRQKVLLLVATVFFVLFIALWLFREPASSRPPENAKAIAVLPFRNINGSDKSNDLAEGITEEVFSQLLVNTALKAKKIPSEKSLAVSEEGLAAVLKNIGAGSYLVGKVQQGKDSLVVFVHLQNAASNEVIWSHVYREGNKSLLRIQHEVAMDIAEALGAKFTPNVISVINRKSPHDTAAYPLYLQGRSEQKNRTQASLHEAIYLFSKATQLDTQYALAYAGIGEAYTLLIDHGFVPYNQVIDSARNALNRAFELDSMSAEIRSSKALFLSSVEGNSSEAEHQLLLALNLDPHYTAAHQWYALELAARGQFDSALKHIDAALTNEPYAERLLYNKFMILKFARRFREIITQQNSMLPIIQNKNIFLAQRVESYYRLNLFDSALLFARLIKDGFSDYDFWEAVIKNDKAQLLKQMQQQQAIEKGRSMDNETVAIYSVYLGDKGKALDALEAAYNNREFSWLKFLNVRQLWDPLRDEPRFWQLLAKLGLRNNPRSL